MQDFVDRTATFRLRIREWHDLTMQQVTAVTTDGYFRVEIGRAVIGRRTWWTQTTLGCDGLPVLISPMRCGQ